MASSNNLDALSQDGELPFGHPGRRFDDTPEGFEPSSLVDQRVARQSDMYLPISGVSMPLASPMRFAIFLS